MFDRRFPEHWTTNRKLIWLVGTGIAGGASAVWKTVTDSLIHITDALASPIQKLEVALEPIQDLHGQDAPYPAGDGKNLFNADTVTTGKYINASGEIADNANSCYTDLIPVVAGETYTYSGVQVGDSNYKRIHAYADGVWQSQIDAPNILTGSFAVTFQVPSGANGIRISAFTSDTNRQVEKGSSATSYAPYSNICPITGWTGATVKHANGNYIPDNNAVSFSHTSLGSTKYSEESDALYSSGNGYSYRNIENYLPLTDENQTFNFTIFLKYHGSSSYYCRLMKNGSTEINFTPPSSSTTDFVKRTGNFTAKKGDSLEFRFYGGFLWKDIQVSLGSGYKESIIGYNYKTTSISWQTEAGTVYGGTLDVISGKLAVDAVKYTFTGQETWGSITSGSRKYFRTIKGERGYFKYSNKDICSHYKRADISSSTTNIGFSAGNVNAGAAVSFRPNLSVISDLTAWEAFLAEQYANGTPVVCAVKLTTPVEYTLTPQEITTLVGENNIWADCGDTTLTYQAVPETAFSDEADKGMADYMTLTE